MKLSKRNRNEKTTERQKKGFIHNQKTGDGTVRNVEEFIHHPQLFKGNLGVGEAVVCIPHNRGVKTVKVKFSILPNLPKVEIPIFEKSEAKQLKPLKKEVAS